MQMNLSQSWRAATLIGVAFLQAGCVPEIAYGPQFGLVVEDARSGRAVERARLVSITGTRKDVLAEGRERGIIFVSLGSMRKNARVWRVVPERVAFLDPPATQPLEVNRPQRHVYWNPHRSKLQVEAAGYHSHKITRREQEKMLYPHTGSESLFRQTSPLIQLQPIGSEE